MRVSKRNGEWWRLNQSIITGWFEQCVRSLTPIAAPAVLGRVWRLSSTDSLSCCTALIRHVTINQLQLAIIGFSRRRRRSSSSYSAYSRPSRAGNVCAAQHRLSPPDCCCRRARCDDVPFSSLLAAGALDYRASERASCWNSWRGRHIVRLGSCSHCQAGSGRCATQISDICGSSSRERASDKTLITAVVEQWTKPF